MENTDDTAIPIFLSSWDIKKTSWDIFLSFLVDSPIVNVLKLAWARLGVPWYVTEFLVSLDEGDSTIIRSPWAEVSFAWECYRGFKAHKPNITGSTKAPGTVPAKFTSQRGVV